MNEIILKGMIRDIEYSHTIGDIEYNKANLIVPKINGEEDVLPLRFKKFSNKYTENQQVELIGNVRTFSEKRPDGTNKVQLYVFTYFDIPDHTGEDVCNKLTIDGRICKMNQLQMSKNGKQSLHFILANNIYASEGKQKLNTYLPVTAFGKIANELTSMQVSDKIMISGRLNSRMYKKVLPDGEAEWMVAYEAVVQKFTKE